MRIFNKSIINSMKKTLFYAFFLSVCFSFSQNTYWQKQTANSLDVKESRKNLPTTEVYSLNFNGLKSTLSNAPKRGEFTGQSNVIVSFPNAEGEFERFRIVEASVMHPDLAARYPGIKSYAGQGVDNPADRIRFTDSAI